LGDEAASRQVVNEAVVKRGAGKGEVGQLLGDWQLGNGERILGRSRLFLGDLGLEQISDDLRRRVLAFEANA
jgi:hypothetical protein